MSFTTVARWWHTNKVACPLRLGLSPIDRSHGITIRCTRSRGPRGFFCLHDFRRGPVNVAVITLAQRQTIMPFRFSLRSIFLFVTTACVGLALYLYWATWVDSHKQGLALDYQIVDSGRCDVAEYQGGIPLGPFPTQTQRITKLHFNNDLHWHRAEHIAYYNKMPFVSTISFNGDGTLISDRVLGVLETFPRLRTV